VVLVAAAIAGCGSSSSSGALSSGGSSPSPVPSGLPAPVGSPSPDPLITHGPSITPSRVLPTAPASAPATQLVSLPWQFLSLADSGRQVVISLDYGGCTAFDYVQVEQTSSSVEITAWGTHSATTHTVCPAFEAILRGAVALDAPLGSRQLLHGPVSRGGITPLVHISPVR
jgi:hypothetical protein